MVILSGNMSKRRMARDLAIDGGVRLDAWVAEHAADVLCIHLETRMVTPTICIQKARSVRNT
jgi:hypothetical protein